MKIFTSAEIREIDAATIRLEPVTSAGLMERAATTLFQRIKDYVAPERKVSIFCGTGNNGGDGLVLGRLMHADGYLVRIFIVETGSARSADMQLNAERLERGGVLPVTITAADQLPVTGSDEVVIDALFGTGLRRPPVGLAAAVIRHINSSGAYIISVDIPSGLFCEDNSGADPDAIVRADRTITFQFPKLSFMFGGSGSYTGTWEAIDIGLHPDTIASMPTPYRYIMRESVRPFLKKRRKHDHKGMFGHTLIMAGRAGQAGAAVLTAGAALRTGAGLVTVHCPCGSMPAMQSALPEAMVSPDHDRGVITTLPDLAPYDAIGAGPGMGTDPDTAAVMKELLEKSTVPMVLDADALNILSRNREWLEMLPPDTVLTPHPAEFRRLTGSDSTDWQLFEEQKEFARRYRCIVVLKGAHTAVALPDGTVWFNSTGNPGMATGGSGDVLTGIIAALLAQGYPPARAAVAGVYLHGLAGDIALRIHSEESLLAGDILMNIGRAFRETFFDSFSVYL